jgi:hypothetical protein
MGNIVDLSLTSSIEKYIAGVYDPHGDVFIDKVLLSVVPFLFIPDGYRVILPRNPIAPAAYPPTNPMFSGFQSQKVGIWCSAAGMPRRIRQHSCATTSLGYAWEDLGSKKPVEDGASKTNNVV